MIYQNQVVLTTNQDGKIKLETTSNSDPMTPPSPTGDKQLQS